MKGIASATFKVKQWEETPCWGAEGEPRLTRASVTYTYEGGLEGEGVVEYLMAYRPGGGASFVGFERVTGRLAGREGSFVLRHTGIYDGGSVTDDWQVVEGAGTGELANLRGQCRFESGHAPSYQVALEYELE